MEKCFDISKVYSEKLTEHIVKNCITIGTLEAFADKEECSVEEALNGRLIERVLEMVRARTGADSWPAFAELTDNLPEEISQNEDVRNVAFDIGVSGWELGYIAGFVDRTKLCEEGYRGRKIAERYD